MKKWKYIQIVIILCLSGIGYFLLSDVFGIKEMFGLGFILWAYGWQLNSDNTMKQIKEKYIKEED